MAGYYCSNINRNVRDQHDRKNSQARYAFVDIPKSRRRGATGMKSEAVTNNDIETGMIHKDKGIAKVHR